MARNKFRKYRMWFFSLTVFAVGLAMMAAAVLANPAPEMNTYRETPSISFALCGDMEMQKIMDEVVKVFMRLKDCEVDVYCFSTEEELREKVIAQVAAGEPFDVVCPDNATFEILQNSGNLCALDQIVANLHADGDDFYSAALACGQKEGLQYALPTGVMTYLICYNQDTFEAASVPSPQDYMNGKQWTAEGFADCIGQLYRATGKPALALLDGKNEDGIIPGNVVEIAGEEVEVVFGSIEYLGVESMQQKFIAGEIPMIVSDLSMTRRGWDVQWDVMPYPSKNSDFTRCVFEVPLIAAANNGNQELAKEFVQFYVSGIGQKLRLEHGECLLPSLNMTFYTSMGDVVFPNHSNYYFFAIENGSYYMD